MNKNILLLLIAILYLIGANAQHTKLYEGEGRKMVRAYFKDRAHAFDAIMMVEEELLGLEVSYEENYLVVYATPEDITNLTNMGFEIKPDPNYRVHHAKEEGNQKGGIPGYPCYNLVEETFEMMEKSVKDHPDLAEIVDAGDSWEKEQGKGGYDLKVLKLTNKEIPGPKPILFVESSIHAREYTTAQLNIRFAEYLMENYGKDPNITWMLDHHEFHGLFYVNPDGRKHAEQGKMWRKNTNTAYCGATSNKRGCDLNRNFDYKWSASGSTDECNETFKGASAASEPEVKSVQNYINRIFAEQKGVYIDLHSHGQILLYVNNDEQNTLAGKITHFNKYKIKPFFRGMTFEWGYHKGGVASFLFELGTAFFQKCDYFEKNIVDKNIEALTYLLQVARDPFKIPYGPDALKVNIDESSKMLSATIDDTRYHNQSNVATQNIAEAEYYIDVAPWQTGAKAMPLEAKDGNFDSKTEEVEAKLSFMPKDGKKHIVYVRGKDADGKWGPVSAAWYESDQVGINKISKIEAINLFPNPANDLLNISFNNTGEFPVKLDLINIIGEVVYSSTYGSKGKINREIDLTDFAGGIYTIKLSSGNSLVTRKFLKN